MHNILKYLFFTLLLITVCGGAKAQSADEVYDKYLDFNMARLDDQTDEAFRLGAEIMPLANKLPAKTQIGFYNSMAKLYEDAEQFDHALPLYERVAAAEPDYYVVHRALGYLYLHHANALLVQLDAVKNDKAAYNQAFANYKAAVNKALPHLEKAQACDPSDETLALIRKLYTATQNPRGLASLNSRLRQLSKSCVTVLNDN